MICITNIQRHRLHNINCCQGRQGTREEEKNKGSKERRKKSIIKNLMTGGTEWIWRGIREDHLISQGKGARRR